MNRISDELLTKLSEFLDDRIGLCFPVERRADLERGIRLAANEFHFENVEACIRWLVSSSPTKEQVEVLSAQLTVGETYFFRERNSFEALRESILPELIDARRNGGRRLRFWSAACCTGEEPYSIAILLDQVVPARKDWNITILATDINPHFLRKAATGVYGKWSFRDAPEPVKVKYFQRTEDGAYRIAPSIQQMVTFSYLNLAEDCYPSLSNNTNAMDVIFCRNMLMYFSRARAAKVIHKLHRCLLNGGWLVIGATEAAAAHFPGFETVQFPGATLYRKRRTEIEKPRIQAADFTLPLTMELPPDTADLLPPPETAPAENDDQMKPAPEQPPQEHSYERAIELYGSGFYSEAARELLALPAQDPRNAAATALLVRAYANQGKLSDALHWCDHAIAAEKLNAVMHYLRATILEEQNHLEEAVEALKRAVYIDQVFVLAHCTLGMLAQRLGKTKESRKHIENALALLRKCAPLDVVPESEGITAGRLIQILQSGNGKTV